MQTYIQSHIRVHPLHPFEHGLLHVHVHVLRHAHLLLSFLVLQFTRIRIGVVVSTFLSGTAVHVYVSK
jgi:hypothetical protein